MRRKEYEVNNPDDFIVEGVSPEEYYIPDTDGRYHLKGSFVDYRMLKRLDEICAKWCDPALSSLLLRNAQLGAGDDGSVFAAEMFDRFGYPEQGEYDEVSALHAAICQARGAMMPVDERRSILVKLDAGVLDGKHADMMIAEAERKSKESASKRALSALSNMTGLVNVLNDHREVMMSDEEKAAAVERWRVQKDFERAKAEMNEAASDLAGKGNVKAAVALRAQHHDLNG